MSSELRVVKNGQKTSGADCEQDVQEHVHMHEMQREDTRAGGQGQERQNKMQEMQLQAAAAEGKGTKGTKSLVLNFISYAANIFSWQKAKLPTEL